MSKFERVTLFFGLVGLLADASAIFVFVTGLLNFNQVVSQLAPSSVSVPAASTAFTIASGLIIVYGWLSVSWYLVRRTFVLRNERPTAFHNPLSGRSFRAVLGVGIFIVPLMIAWMIVISSFSTEPSTSSSGVIVPTGVPTITSQANHNVTATSIVSAINQTPTPRPMTPEEVRSLNAAFGFTFGLILGIPLLFLVVYGSINLLMPLVHVEMLGD